MDGFDRARFLSELQRFFVVRQVESWPELAQAMKRGDACLGLMVNEPVSFFLLELRSEAMSDPAFLPGIESPTRELNVTLLHEGILRPYLGIGPEELASQKYVDYFRDAEELLSGIQTARYQLGFILNPTTLEQVRLVSEKGEKMPQKSTDFYPKLLTGLAIMKMEIQKD